MVTVVTGAAGFLGSALAKRLAGKGELRLIDREQGDLTDRAFLAEAVADARLVYHLAALPGGAAEGAPDQSRRTNVEVVLNLLELLPPGTRLIHASSIAVFGAPLPAAIDDATEARPGSVYGTHKRMAELALADAVRRGADAVSLRLPGLVARPGNAEGFASAFMSEVFHAFRDGTPILLPVSPDATVWLMSVERCVDNLLHAAIANGPAVLTLPVVRARMGDLVDALAAATGRAATLALWEPNPAIEAAFGRLPPLDAAAAIEAGYASDGDLAALVARVLG